MKKNLLIAICVIAIVIAAFFLRTIALPDNLLFGYEQGRDALVVRDIVIHHDFTLLGPKTDLEGIYHGVGYYYILTLFYLVTNGNPAQTIFLLAFANALTCLVVFFLAKELIGKTKYALLAALMTAFSFDIILYGRWLSNVSLSIPLVALFFYGLVKLVKTKNPMYWLLVGPIAGFLSHFELLHTLYALVTLTIATKLFGLPIKNRQFLLGIGLFFVTISSFILFEVRHNFLMTNAVLHYITSQALSVNPLTMSYTYIDKLVTNLVTSIFPTNGIIIFLLLLALIAFYLRDKGSGDKSFQLLILMVFFSLPHIFLIKIGTLEHFYAGTAVAWILLFNFLISKYEKKLSLPVFIGIYALLLLGNVSYIERHLTDRHNIFYHAVQKNYTYKDQIAVMDYIFSRADTGFTIESITIPYYHQQAWQYLYDWYGKNKYPEPYARNARDETPKMFVIIEPGIGDKFLKATLDDFDTKTKLINKTKIGDIEVQERIKNR